MGRRDRFMVAVTFVLFVVAALLLAYFVWANALPAESVGSAYG